MRDAHTLVFIGGAALTAAVLYYWQRRTSQATDSASPDAAQSTLFAPSFVSIYDAPLTPAAPDPFAMTSYTFPSTRGWRNNNPGNLRFIEPSRAWRGQVGNDGTGYGVYDTLSNGVRAAGHQLIKYVQEGKATVREIISTWAPSSENDTLSYIADVSTRLAINPDSAIDLDADRDAFLDAIFVHENGSSPLPLSQIKQWVES